MKKSINSTRAKNSIAKLLGEAINNRLHYYWDEKAPKVEVESTCNYTNFIISSIGNYQNMITSSEIEVVLEAIKPYIEKYYNVHWCMLAKQRYNAEYDSWLNYPVMEVSVEVKAENWKI